MTTPETSSSAKILVVDDEPNARVALTELLREEGYEVHCAADGYKALGRIDPWIPDAVITDVKMPGLGGIELIAKLRELLPDVAVVVMTAFGSVEGAVQAIQLGADDYLSKPVDFGQLLVVLQRTLARRALKREAAQPREAIAERDGDASAGMVGASKAFRDLLGLARQVAGSPASVLIRGESGSGKQTLARQIHAWSGRTGPFVAVECGAVRGAAGEAELFGQREGDRVVRAGRLQEARGGTLFLDGVDELSPGAQGRLLQVLQERQGLDDEASEREARLVASSTRDLATEVKAGRFREDLLYRLAVVSLRVPPLRERQDDISPLAQHFLRSSSRRAKKPIAGFGERALKVLLGFDWPGNVRQLESCVEQAVVMAHGPEIEPRDLPRELMARARGDEAPPAIPGTSLHELERFAILRTLEHVGGSTSKAARILGVSPRKIQYRIQEYRETSADKAGK